jgi:hypothetical protein
VAPLATGARNQPVDRTGRAVMTSSVYALNAANFFMADVRDGLGPFLGVFLQEKNWSPARACLQLGIPKSVVE